MHENELFLLDAGGDAGAGGGSAPAAGGEASTTATPAAGASPAPGAAGENPGATGGGAASGSLLARGSAAPAAGSGDGGQPAGDAASATKPAIPEKYLVKREDGSTDWEASALKQAQGYTSLEKRLGSGDAPPKSPEDYAPVLPQGIDLATLQKDPLYSGFIKGAHSRGMTNAQLSYVLEGWAARESMRNSPEAAEAELRREWATDEALGQGLNRSFRAVAAFAGGDETRAKLEAKFGNDPDFIRLMARIGTELGEDKAAAVGLNSAEADTLETLMASPAYLDKKHADHARVVAKTRELYAKKFGAS